MKKRNIELIRAILLLVFLVGILIISAMLIPVGGDFKNYFRPAGQMLLHGQSPYNVSGFYNPPWLAILFIPFALLPQRLSWVIFYTLNFLTYIIALKRFEIKTPGLIIIMSSPYVIFSLWYGNVESLIYLGATLHPFFGIWFLLMKPQMSLGLIALWVFRSFRGGFKKGLQDFGLIAICCLLIWVLGWVPLKTPIYQTWNLNIFPWGIILGLVLFYIAVKTSDKKLALSASPFFSPYVAVQSWSVTLLPVTTKFYWGIVGNIMGWIFVLLWMYTKGNFLIGEFFILYGWGVVLVSSQLWEFFARRKKEAANIV